MAGRQMELPAVDNKTTPNSKNEDVSFAARLITQGRHRFYTLTMPSDVLAETCVVDTREENPDDGFQRALDRKRAQEIADYIDIGFGTIPCSIVLSAQPEAALEYISRTQVLRFKKSPRSFLILDGQHRVFGFKLAKARLRVQRHLASSADRAQTSSPVNYAERNSFGADLTVWVNPSSLRASPNHFEMDSE
jgi:hypothetical protein